jgi:hypothetical protein|tara:strand:+ start:1598 stop:1756 length:159 start_codon:yes stop_codon:yes gene_type:complete
LLEKQKSIGRFVAFGLVIGLALFALTKSPIWIGLGLVVGAVIGAQVNRKDFE